MNRHQRRAKAAKTRASTMRHEAIADALSVIRTLDDPTISGATLILPDGQVVHVDADAARTTPKPGEAVQ